MTDGILVLVFIAIVTIGLFLVFRWIVLWYWKIDKIVERLDGILAQLRQLNGLPRQEGEGSRPIELGDLITRDRYPDRR